MRGVNRVTLIGNLGKDPEIQHLEGNIAVAKFPLATTESFKDKTGQMISQTEWHTVVLWRGLAELAQRYLHKGSLVYIEGRLRTRNWEDKDKNRRFATEIVGDNLVMLDKRKEADQYGQASAEGHGDIGHFAVPENMIMGDGSAKPATTGDGLDKDILPF
jgi:single-strand DNA-binding protein